MRQVYGALGLAPGPAPLPLATVRGRVSSTQGGCSDNRGSAPVRLTAVEVPPSFAWSLVTCHYVSWSLLQQLRANDSLVNSALFAAAVLDKLAATFLIQGLNNDHYKNGPPHIAFQGHEYLCAVAVSQRLTLPAMLRERI